jgi:hypothetical protein
MFLVGAKPLLLDRADIAAAELIAPAGVRLRGVDGTVVELVPA